MVFLPLPLGEGTEIVKPAGRCGAGAPRRHGDPDSLSLWERAGVTGLSPSPACGRGPG